jgi:hypothetical protein
VAVRLPIFSGQKYFFPACFVLFGRKIDHLATVLETWSHLISLLLFRNVLRRHPHQHPLLYLKGVKYKELVSVLNFMYQGEVNIAQEELNSFLAVAEELKVKGKESLSTRSCSPSSTLCTVAGGGECGPGGAQSQR